MDKLLKIEIRKLITKGETKKALALLTDVGNPRFKKTVVILSGRFAMLQNKKQHGVIDFDEEKKEQNQINLALMDLLDEKSMMPGIGKQKRNRSVIVLLGFFLVVGSIVFYSALFEVGGEIKNETSGTVDSSLVIDKPKEIKYEVKKGGEKNKINRPLDGKNNKPNVAPSYFNEYFEGAIALFSTSERGKGDFSNLLKVYLSEQLLLKTTSVFFNQEFKKKYSHRLKGDGMNVFREVNVDKRIKCVCLIEEEVDFVENNIAGLELLTAQGHLKVQLYNLASGVVNEQYFSTQGAGETEFLAVQSMKESMALILPKENHLKFSLCKK